MNLPNKPKILAATYNPVSNTKMISFLVDFPTVLLAELRTHRILTQGSLYEHSELVDFNLSANSARAIPHNKYLEKVIDNPFIPIWTKQQKGMSGELITDKNKIEFYNNTWKGNLQMFVDYGIENYTSGEQIHKQNINRLLAPFAYTTCIISGTEWDNFFSLRNPKYEIDGKVYLSKKQAQKELGLDEENLNITDWQSINKSTAQPEFQIIAEMLYDLYQEANWKESKYHIPFEEDINKEALKEYLHKNHKTYEHDQPDSEHILNQFLMLISASMCAKLSYNTQENEDTLEKHLERANMLIEHKHQEPFSHQAVAMNKYEYENMFIQSIVNVNGEKEIKREMGVAYNLRGFKSFRYIIENEQ